MLEALLLAAGLTTGGAIGFAIAWTRGAPAREELAAVTARAEEQERAAADKLAVTMRGNMVPADIYDMAVQERDAFRKTKGK